MIAAGNGGLEGGEDIPGHGLDERVADNIMLEAFIAQTGKFSGNLIMVQGAVQDMDQHEFGFGQRMGKLQGIAGQPVRIDRTVVGKYKLPVHNTSPMFSPTGYEGYVFREGRHYLGLVGQRSGERFYCCILIVPE
jgi:hypothetical protein